MTKRGVHYVCQQCGRTAPKPLGRCPQCGAWNSMLAEVDEPPAARSRRTAATAVATRLGDIGGDADGRVPVPIEEFARVLGGGIVPGSIVLIGGDPGIGKSTLLLQVALALAERGPALYVSGEESVRQIKGRAERLGAGDGSGLLLMAETELEGVLSQIEAVQPGLAVIDSIQTMYDSTLESAAGSITQVRQCAARLQALAKGSGVPIFLIGHVTKDGAIAGPRVLEHLVDTVLYLEGDAQHAYRLLRAVKNRFGPTTEVGVFEMSGAGMAEVPNPSEAFLAERVVQAPGSVVGITLEGSRPLLVEIQGLTSPTAFGNPRRTANGVDLNRLLLMTAVLTRRLGMNLSDQDVFVNVVGGLRIDEPAADLAIAVALASSLRDRPVPVEAAVVGEVGLSGELRAVPQLNLRLREAAKLGFRRVVAPRSHRMEAAPSGVELIAARSLREALDLLVPRA
jgi:DNA repair protein RadA/Sms